MKIEMNTRKSWHGVSAGIALAGALVCTQPRTASAAYVMSPQKTAYACALGWGGDLEFAGNGPDVEVVSTLHIAATYAYMDVGVEMWETAPDWTVGSGFSTLDYLMQVSDQHRLQYVWKLTDGVWGWSNITYEEKTYRDTVHYIDTDMEIDVFGFTSWFVQDVSVMGDTPGNDTLPGFTCPPSTADSHVRVANNPIWFVQV